MATPKSFFNLLERLNFKSRELNFRFPIETLEKLLKQFYKDSAQSAFLLQTSNQISNLTLKKINKSFLLSVPLQNRASNEQLYIGLSDLMAFLVLFDEPEPDEQGISTQQSRFFLTFDPFIIHTVFGYFYKNYCRVLSVKEKKLLIKLKNAQGYNADPSCISRFQEALLINALHDSNKVNQSKILEAISFTDESIIITDLAGNIKETNRCFNKNFASVLKENSVKEILTDELFNSAVSEVTRQSKWQSEISLNLAGKKPQLLLVNVSLFRDEIERPSGFVFTFKDITELKKLDNLNKQLISKLRERNTELTEVNKRLLEADRIKTDLLSVVSHELKTPVSTILGFSELILNREVDPESARNYAEQINDSAKNLDRLITDYLDVASNQFGVSSNNKLYTMPVNLADLIRVAYEEEKSNFNTYNFDFELNCLGFEPIVITEAQNMKKLFGNLINNSLKYSPNGGKISVKILNDGERVTISVSDQGVGLTKEQTAQVFEPFYRTDNSVTREFPGIGLGLAVSKKIVELYNGSIWCEPGVDLGSVFYVILPVNPHIPLETPKLHSELKEKQKLDAKVRDR